MWPSGSHRFPLSLNGQNSIPKPKPHPCLSWPHPLRCSLNHRPPQTVCSLHLSLPPHTQPQLRLSTAQTPRSRQIIMYCKFGIMFAGSNSARVRTPDHSTAWDAEAGAEICSPYSDYGAAWAGTGKCGHCTFILILRRGRRTGGTTYSSPY